MGEWTDGISSSGIQKNKANESHQTRQDTETCWERHTSRPHQVQWKLPIAQQISAFGTMLPLNLPSLALGSAGTMQGGNTPSLLPPWLPWLYPVHAVQWLLYSRWKAWSRQNWNSSILQTVSHNVNVKSCSSNVVVWAGTDHFRMVVSVFFALVWDYVKHSKHHWTCLPQQLSSIHRLLSSLR